MILGHGRIWSFTGWNQQEKETMQQIAIAEEFIKMAEEYCASGGVSSI
jgi:hypothetical protein